MYILSFVQLKPEEKLYRCSIKFNNKIKNKNKKINKKYKYHKILNKNI